MVYKVLAYKPEQALHWCIEIHKCNLDGFVAWCYICEAEACWGSMVVNVSCLRPWFFPCAGMTDRFLLRKGRAGGIVAMLAWVPPTTLLQAGSPGPPSVLAHLHLSPAAVALPQSWRAGFIFFLSGLSGTPGNAIDCDKSLDYCLFELPGMHLNFNVFIS